MSMQSQDIVRRSGTNTLTPAPHVRDHQAKVAKLIDVTTCIGCKACQVACNEWNDLRDEVGHNVGVYDNPADLGAKTWTLMRFDEIEHEETGKLEWLIRKDGCMHCEDPGCLKACPTGAITFGSKDDMKQLAHERVEELKTRGYDEAGLYDPQGVGGTHVMYVLHHADRPELYHKLPSEPTISPVVESWKGALKPVAGVAFAAALVGAAAHYIAAGPNEVPDDDETGDADAARSDARQDEEPRA